MKLDKNNVNINHSHLYNCLVEFLSFLKLIQVAKHLYIEHFLLRYIYIERINIAI